MLLIIITHFVLALTFQRSYGAPLSGIHELKNEVVVVDFGQTAELHCTSNDQDHNFLFWQLEEPVYAVIGPGNGYDKVKYEYEVLSGKLFIKAVTTEEQGIYNCVSRGIRNDNINIRPVKMIVRKDWEEVYENDPGVNFFRAVVVIGTFVVLLGGSYLMYKNWKIKQIPYFSDMNNSFEAEDSAEETFKSPQPSTSGQIVRNSGEDGYDNFGLSTDFKSLLNNGNNKD